MTMKKHFPKMIAVLLVALIAFLFFYRPSREGLTGSTPNTQKGSSPVTFATGVTLQPFGQAQSQGVSASQLGTLISFTTPFTGTTPPTVLISLDSGTNTDYAVTGNVFGTTQSGFNVMVTNLSTSTPVSSGVVNVNWVAFLD